MKRGVVMAPRKVFEMELTQLHNELLRMGSIVEKQINQCIKA
jgi:phosphate transport system protein